jgi:hypothetical protein
MDFQKHGIEFSKDLIMQGSQKAYVKDKTFGEHVKSVFLPDVAKLAERRKSNKRKPRY